MTPNDDGLCPVDFDDDELCALIQAEKSRQSRTLPLVASAGVAPWQVGWSNGSAFTNVTAEGYPGRRYHPGTEVFDDLETLAVNRARRAFAAPFANVQPHSGTSANLAALTALMPHGGTVLSMSMKSGGHLSHGARASITSTLFNIVHYGVGPDGLIDFTEVRRIARETMPSVIMCGGSSYPRAVDFASFRRVADEVGAALVADISHIAGLVVCGFHPSPVPYADLVTTSTYKQLAGPRGGLVLGGSRRPHVSDLEQRVERAVFPGAQGTPCPNAIAAKAWALRYVQGAHFRHVCRGITATADTIARTLAERGFTVATGGTDTHMVLIDLQPSPISGWVAEKALESCGVLVNRNCVPHDPRPASTTSGIRIGTNGFAARGGTVPLAHRAATIAADVLDSLVPQGDRQFALASTQRHRALSAVGQLIDDLDPPSEPHAYALTSSGDHHV